MRNPSRATRRTRIFVLALVAGAGACRDAPTGTTPSLGIGPAAAVSRLELVDGSAQSAPVATALARPFVVRLLNRGGNPVKNAIVAWTVTAGGGSLPGPTTITDGDGITSARLTLGTTAGENSVTAAVHSSPPGRGAPPPIAFAATGVAGPPASVDKLGGDEQTAVTGEPLEQPLEVLVTDRYGNPVAGTAVTWSAPPGSGSVVPTGETTDPAGRASARWTLGDAGPNVATVVVGEVAPVTFSATALPPVPAAIAIVSGDAQRDTVTKTLAAPLVVRVNDRNGRPMSGVSVAWAVTHGGGSVSAPATFTDASGTTSVRYTLGPTAGAHSVRATVGESLAATFGATAMPAPMCSLTWNLSSNAGTGGSTIALTSVARDRYGNAVDFRGPAPTAEWPSTPANFEPGPGDTWLWKLPTWSGYQRTTVTTYTCDATASSRWGFPRPGTAYLIVYVSAPPNTRVSLSAPGHADTVATQVEVWAHASSESGPAGNVGISISLSGGGSIIGLPLTDYTGTAVFKWKLGTVVGPNTLIAAFEGAADTITVNTRPGHPQYVAIIRGDGQVARPGTTLPIPPTVKVTDRFGNPVVGILVNWFLHTPSGGAPGSVTPTSGLTTSDGAQTSWTLGPGYGFQALAAWFSSAWGGDSKLFVAEGR